MMIIGTEGALGLPTAYDNQGWTGKLFFSQGGAGRGGARPKFFGAGNPPFPTVRGRAGRGVHPCFSLACPGQEYRGHKVKSPTPVYSFPCPEKDDRWHCHDFMLETHLYQVGEDEGQVLSVFEEDNY